MGAGLASIGGLIDLGGLIVLYGTVWGWWPLGLVIAPFMFATGFGLLLYGLGLRHPIAVAVIILVGSAFLEVVFRLGLWGTP